jgi:hypothetical protein
MCLSTMEVTTIWSPNKSRIHDVVIMTAITDPSVGISTKDIQMINRYRVYL